MNLESPRWIARDEVAAGRPALEGTRFTGLWVAGSLDGLRAPAVAVVGSRSPSEAGRLRARAFGRDLARAGVTVLSGLALGIDAAAHEGALDVAGTTIGMLGGGHRCFFPRRNLGLAERMVASGGAVLSPFDPDEPARPGQFIQRNGVLAALADAVVVIEAAARSGSLNTANWAAARSIAVLAVPGDPDRSKAAGCNALIRDGAILVRDAADVLGELKSAAALVPRSAGPAEVEEARSALPPAVDTPLARALVALLASEPATLEQLAQGLAQRRSHANETNVATLIGTLALLELHGALRCDDGRWRLASNDGRA